jgi:Asp-tRNA(Asn)/Glu-tRNA(Gln) amidotransferase A subunit family amidase
MCSLGEETRASTRGPANHNAVALILPHKSMVGFTGGAIGADIYCDRTGILARRIGDCARVLDALKNPDGGTYDPRDIWTTVPRSSVLPAYAPHATGSGAPGALKGMRIGIVRESMLVRPGEKATVPICTAAAAEIKSVLGRKLGATLVESSDPLWERDRDIEQMSVDFRQALARLVPVLMPDLLFRLGPDGTPLFKEVAAAIQPTEFGPAPTPPSPAGGGGSGWGYKVFGIGILTPIDYCVQLAEGQIAPPANLDIATVQQQELANTFRFHIAQYLSRRAADWQARGHTESLVDWAALNARSKFWGDDGRAAFKNWEEVSDPRNPLGGRQGVDERVMLRELLRRVDMMVMLENRLDALVRLHTPLPPGKIGGAHDPLAGGSNIRAESMYGPNAGLTEILIPAGYVTEVWDPVFKLSPDGKRYAPAPAEAPTTLPAPGLPFSLVFRADPGREDVVLKIASSYEAASKRRIPPPAFGPV